MAQKKPKQQISAPKLKMMWEFLQSPTTGDYEFVRNIITKEIMWRYRGDKKAPFQVMTDEKLNSIIIDLLYAGQSGITAESLTMFLYSEYTAEFHPITAYLDKLPARSGAIQRLADTVVTTNKPMWEKFLRMYLIACVANVYRKERNTNDFCLTFTGAMGKGKSSWQKYLCPPQLDDYMYIGELDLSNFKDTFWMLSRYWFIIIEEQLKGLNQKDEKKMRALISQPNLKGRRHFRRFDSSAPRISNFFANSNDNELISDLSRRYLIFETIEFKLNDLKKIKIDDVWAEAVTAYKKDEKYWIEDSEIKELIESNKRFNIVTDEMEYVMQYIGKPESPGEVTHILPATVIRDFIGGLVNNKFLSKQRIGNAMSRIGFQNDNVKPMGASYSIHGWAVRINTDDPTVNRYKKELINTDSKTKP